MMHLLVQQAQEPLLLLPLVIELSTCLNPFFLVLYGPSAREEELNQFHSLSATTAR